VQRVPVNRPAKGVPAPRYEGEILVIPVLEEVLVVSKQLVVKEELRIRRRAKRSPHRQRVLLRSEVAVVEREPAATGAARRPSNLKGARKWRRQ
jgi:stress response protein YsnF